MTSSRKQPVGLISALGLSLELGRLKVNMSVQALTKCMSGMRISTRVQAKVQSLLFCTSCQGCGSASRFFMRSASSSVSLQALSSRCNGLCGQQLVSQKAQQVRNSEEVAAVVTTASSRDVQKWQRNLSAAQKFVLLDLWMAWYNGGAQLQSFLCQFSFGR